MKVVKVVFILFPERSIKGGGENVGDQPSQPSQLKDFKGLAVRVVRGMALRAVGVWVAPGKGVWGWGGGLIMMTWGRVGCQEEFRMQCSLTGGA